MDNVGIDEPKADYDDNEGDNEELEDKRRESVQFGLDRGQVRRVRISYNWKSYHVLIILLLL